MYRERCKANGARTVSGAAVNNTRSGELCWSDGGARGLWEGDGIRKPILPVEIVATVDQQDPLAAGRNVFMRDPDW